MMAAHLRHARTALRAEIAQHQDSARPDSVREDRLHCRLLVIEDARWPGDDRALETGDLGYRTAFGEVALEMARCLRDGADDVLIGTRFVGKLGQFLGEAAPR